MGFSSNERSRGVVGWLRRLRLRSERSTEIWSGAVLEVGRAKTARFVGAGFVLVARGASASSGVKPNTNKVRNG